MIEHPRMSDFLISLEPEPPKLLRSMREYADTYHIPIVREETEAFLRTVTGIVSPRRILELGTAIGFSAIVMALSAGEALEELITVESYEKRVEEAAHFIKAAGLDDRIRIKAADIDEAFQDLIPETESFDLIFLDAAKGQYLRWLPGIKKRMDRGSVLIADNVLQEGTVLESRFALEHRERSTHARMREFLYEIKHDDDFSSAIIPLGDGVSLTLRR